MQAEGTLALVAEISVAFAGFTSIVAVFGTRGDDSWSSRESSHLRILVEYSLVTLAIAVLPLILWNAGLSEETAWRAASGAVAVEIAGYYLIRMRSLREDGPHLGPRFFGWIAFTWDCTFIVLLILNAAAFFPNLATVYVANLYFNLLGTSLTFASAIAPLWSRRS